MTGEVPPATGGSGELRASHADRDHVVEVLRIAAGDGRITAEELDQRLETALTARTLGELAVLTTDLPAAPSRQAAAAAARAKDLVRIDCVASNTRRDGAWVVPRRMEVRVNGGSVRLDFTQATITQPLLELAVDVQHGHLVLVTGPGIVVDADDVAVEHGHVKAPHPAAPAMALALRIEVTGTVRGGTLIARPQRPRRRTFLQWLLRRPAPTPPALTR
jgi:Domain of unknown function (DUF1707)